MFMCPDCHQKEIDSGVCSGWHPFTSHGKCELCDKVANCVDCKAYKYVQPKETKCKSSE